VSQISSSVETIMNKIIFFLMLYWTCVANAQDLKGTSSFYKIFETVSQDDRDVILVKNNAFVNIHFTKSPDEDRRDKFCFSNYELGLKSMAYSESYDKCHIESARYQPMLDSLLNAGYSKFIYGNSVDSLHLLEDVIQYWQIRDKEFFLLNKDHKYFFVVKTSYKEKQSEIQFGDEDTVPNGVTLTFYDEDGYILVAITSYFSETSYVEVFLF